MLKHLWSVVLGTDIKQQQHAIKMPDFNISHCFVRVLVGKDKWKMPCPKPVVEKKVLSTSMSTMLFITGFIHKYLLTGFLSHCSNSEKTC